MKKKSPKSYITKVINLLKKSYNTTNEELLSIITSKKIMSAKVYCKELIDAEMSKNGYEFLMPIKIYWCNSRGKFYTKYTHIAGLYGKVFGNITLFKFARAVDGADELPYIGVFDIERIRAREIHIIDDSGKGEYAEVNARNLDNNELNTSGFYFNFPY